jgi:hypothetical protein
MRTTTILSTSEVDRKYKRMRENLPVDCGDMRIEYRSKETREKIMTQSNYWSSVWAIPLVILLLARGFDEVDVIEDYVGGADVTHSQARESQVPMPTHNLHKAM